MPTPEFQENNQQTQESESETSEFGNQFLNGVEEADREVVGKYIKEWDGQVTKKFQGYSDKLKGYEELGDVASLTSAHQLMQDVQGDPVGFYNYYRDYLIENAQAIQEQFGIEDINVAMQIAEEQMSNEEVDQSGLPENEGFNEQQVTQFSQMQEAIETNSQMMQDMQSSQQEADQMKILDNTLSELHTEHGQFDDTYVLTQIANGKSPADAVGAYQELTQSIIDNQANSAPNLMNGPSGTPLDQVDKTKLNDPKFRKELGAQILSSHNQRS